MCDCALNKMQGLFRCVFHSDASQLSTSAKLIRVINGKGLCFCETLPLRWFQVLTELC